MVARKLAVAAAWLGFASLACHAQDLPHAMQPTYIIALKLHTSTASVVALKQLQVTSLNVCCPMCCSICCVTICMSRQQCIIQAPSSRSRAQSAQSCSKGETLQLLTCLSLSCPHQATCPRQEEDIMCKQLLESYRLLGTSVNLP